MDDYLFITYVDRWTSQRDFPSLHSTVSESRSTPHHPISPLLLPWSETHPAPSTHPPILSSRFPVSPFTFNPTCFVSSSQTWGKSYLKVILGTLSCLTNERSTELGFQLIKLLNSPLCKWLNFFGTPWWLITVNCDPGRSFTISPSSFYLLLDHSSLSSILFL